MLVWCWEETSCKWRSHNVKAGPTAPAAAIMADLDDLVGATWGEVVEDLSVKNGRVIVAESDNDSILLSIIGATSADMAQKLAKEAGVWPDEFERMMT